MSNEQQIAILEEKRKKINEISPSFCAAKWLQTTLYLQNGYNHSCHHPSPHKIPEEEVIKNPAALHNSSFKKEQRKKMLKGDRPSECDYCWKIEDLNKNYFSDRHYKTADWWSWDRVEEIADSNADDDINPSYLEVSFSNVCNFACSYCSSEISSKWLSEINQHGPYPTSTGNHDLNWLKTKGQYPYSQKDYNPYVEAFWQWFPEALPTLKVLRVTGGEPTLSKDTWKLLDFLESNPQPHLKLGINTNLGVEDFLIDRLIKKINKLKGKLDRIEIYTSAESIGEHAEYVRDGIDYQKWYSNVDKILSETGINVVIMTTINMLSLPSLFNFIEDILQLRVKFNTDFAHNKIPLSINYLRWPLYLQCHLLDQDQRIKYADEIEAKTEKWLKYYSPEKYARIYLEEWDQIKRFCDYLRTGQTAYEYRKDFVAFINEFDKRRNKDFTKAFPEYKNLLEEWNA